MLDAVIRAKPGTDYRAGRS